MCGRCCSRECLRSLDKFGAPIGLTFDKDSSFKTAVGGFVTLMVYLLLGANVLAMIGTVWIKPQYTSKKTSSYREYSEGEDPWTIYTNQTTIAGTLGIPPNEYIELPDELTLDQLFRVQFLNYIIKDGLIQYQYVGAIQCSEKYYGTKQWDKIGAEFASEDELWICPDVDEFEIINNPAVYRSQAGQAFYLVVNSCEYAQKIDQTFALSTYNPVYNCATQDVSDQFANLLEFRSKVMTQDPTSPSSFVEDGSSIPYFTQRIQTYMSSELIQIYRTTAQQVRVNYFDDNQWYSFLPLVRQYLTLVDYWIPGPNDVVDFDLVTYDFDVQQSSLDFQNGLQEKSYISVAISQSEQTDYIFWSQTTIMSVLASLGGQIVAILGIVNFLLGGYQAFVYQTEALKKLYYQIDNNESDSDSEGFDEDNLHSWKSQLKEKVDGRTRITFSYSSYVAVSLLSSFCCCIADKMQRNSKSWYSRRKKVIDKFNIAQEKLNSEVDMLNILQLLRISRFLNRLSITRRQRQTVPYFRRYTVHDYEIQQQKKRKKDMPTSDLIAEIDPTVFEKDKRIIYELTGILLDQTDFDDDSSFEEADLGMRVDNLIGQFRYRMDSQGAMQRINGATIESPLIEKQGGTKVQDIAGSYGQKSPLSGEGGLDGEGQQQFSLN